MDEAAVCLADVNFRDPLTVCTRICLVGDVRKDSKTTVAAEKFGIPVVESDSGSEFLNDGTCDTVFITNDFSGSAFEAIHRSEQRIMGPTALQECAEKGDTLPHNTRPLYCHAMAGLVVCFTGFRKKDELNRMITLIHNMGGSIRKDMVAKVTHLIANNCGGEKYRYAVTFRVPIMSDTWVYKCWEQRDNVGFSAVSDEMMCHKMKPFVGARVCFYGFPDEERQHMTEILLQNGGEVTDVEDGTSTHVVVDGAEKYYLLKHRMVISKRWSLSPTSSTATTNLNTKVTRLSNNTPTDLAPQQLTSPRCSTPYCHCGRSMENNSGFSSLCVKDRSISPASNGINRCLSFGESVLHKCDMVDIENVMNESCVTLINDSDSGERHVFKQITNSVPKVRTNSLMEHSVQSAQHRKCIPKRSASSLGTELSVEDYFVPDKMPKFDIETGKARESVHEESACKSAMNTSFGPYKTLFMEVISDSDRGRSPQFSSPTITAVCKPTVKSCGYPRVAEEDVLTELVVDESNVQSVPDLTINAPIVKAEWFWKSVQNEAQADEKEHLFEDYLETAQSPASWRTSQDTPSSTASVRARKRKRLRDVASRLLQQNESPAIHKRRSSVSDAGLLSMSGSFLDSCSATPDKQDEVEAVLSETPRKNLSPRQQVFFELLQTESNYVGILDTIMTLFKSPLEDVSEQGGALLNNTELKIIFGNLPPIYEVHKQMLEELRSAAASWKEEISIGKIFLKYVPDLVKAYPPFVNFFENTKEMLVMCDQTKPRFHAFLKICQTKPECGRQSLQELLIRPVQRLPSISLLLNDILKHTSKSNPDHAALEKAIASIREVMTHINEDKRKTEGQLVMFDIFNDIDNCPPHLVSSHRSFIVRCDVMELSDGLSGRGDNLVFFLFSDTMEVCKKRSKTFNSLKSPNTSNLHSAKMSSVKPFKHVRLMPLTHIKRVIDIRETDECHNVFALMCRSNQELKDKLYSFTIADEETEKLGFLRTLCRQMANTVCKTDAENFLMSLDSHQLDIDTSDVALGTLSKAFNSWYDRFASRTRMKVGRAFSFNKTPSKLKRAVSTMMSPFGSTTNLTPASQLAQMRLASCNNLNELGSSPSKEETTLVAPLSVQPTRKNKSSSLNMSSLRRL
ncbi:protein ECT2 isoform X1 [Schistocerca americana]|uniref:protein ECT2 isoform X1 n=1 Tax=Schistocerca americana TaxID=7009 RepID=UPI001F4FC223|nr:protein ECT2 isoform X1 [Schistocerca americana]